MRDRLLKIFLYLILSGLLLLAVQGLSGFVRERELLGGDEAPAPCPLSGDSIFSGGFQKYVNLYLNYNMGFRRSLVRFNNQLAFTIFRCSNYQSVVVGKHQYLYEMAYVNSYRGLDYIGRARIINKIRRLQEFQKRLSREHINFLLVFSPSKARFMPENLPETYHEKGLNTNYETYVDILTHEAKDLHFLDLNKYLRLMKDTSRYTLYPKGGSHWSTFAAIHYALDTLLRHMESLSGNKYPLLRTGPVHWTDTLSSPDDDLSVLLNLVCPYPANRLPYAGYTADSAGRTKPHPLVIADSYFWLIFGFTDIKQYFRDCDFWAWNSDFYPKSKYKDEMSGDFVFLQRDILSHDFVILMVTEINLFSLLSFDEKIYPLFDPNNPLVLQLQKKRAERIAFFKAMILADPKWTALIRQKADFRKISFDEMVQRDAEYMTEMELNNLTNK